MQCLCNIFLRNYPNAYLGPLPKHNPCLYLGKSCEYLRTHVLLLSLFVGDCVFGYFYEAEAEGDDDE